MPVLAGSSHIGAAAPDTPRDTTNGARGLYACGNAVGQHTGWDTVVINGRRWFDATKNQRVAEPSIFRTVVCHGDLADHVANTLTKGTAVAASGSFADDSYTPPAATTPSNASS